MQTEGNYIYHFNHRELISYQPANLKQMLDDRYEFSGSKETKTTSSELEKSFQLHAKYYSQSLKAQIITYFTFIRLFNQQFATFILHRQVLGPVYMRKNTSLARPGAER